MARAENKAEAGGTAHLVAALAKALREQLQLSQEQVGKMTGYTASAISAMETCAQPASDQMLVKLEEAIGGGLRVFDKARKWMLLEKYPARFRGFSELEAGAVTLSSYETLVVDGLFQTEEYARALISGSYPPVSEPKREELVEARLARRKLFERSPAPMIELILEEAVLRRPFGSWEILRGQLRSLAEDARRDNVCVQVLPLDRGLRGTYAGDRGAMKLVETKEHEHVVYMEIEDQGILINDPAEVSQLAHRYAKIRAQALSPDESLGLIERLAGEEG
ncbi:helix-turn-helix transcriptional regulator [Streptomyces sp. NBC_00878]|uniref:helix-turn-helix domain-containing protein n=1 Tax=Streptomyces sp. NBC_00878 TaxID=2975854 RepID=UPI002251F3B7|nr:Scr1 family TA system antitoxin-like transcriptional regulator [Streptomyces sp. NBC_00878]MCX4907588.1 Scr1 family TA system antitoxin-like transcriptional regulator [Streptomyces sp. NBC_00878]